MFQAAPSAYVTFVGYDEVAHHAGPETGDAMRTLRRLDTAFSRLERASAGAPRPYKFMVLSAHGQGTGTPLRQKGAKSLQELVQSPIQEKARVAPAAAGTAGTG